MAINKEWHLKNKMPANPTFDQKSSWHIQHVMHCDCRKIPQKLAEQMNHAGIDYPKDKVEKP